MDRRPAPVVFGEWALSGRDEGMERGHSASVALMLDMVLPSLKYGYTAIDAGCGNGWVVRTLNGDDRCLSAIGVDAASEMIEKANSIDPSDNYVLANIEDWSPGKEVDLVHSMEVLYYLGDISKFLSRVREEWLVEGGTFVAGLDHYRENPESWNWPDACGIDMNLMSISEWEAALETAGFSEVQSTQVNAEGEWMGTLVLMASV